jgi:NitT/TauT family transport system permease protein
LKKEIILNNNKNGKIKLNDDTVYWKAKSKIWFWLSILSFVLAFTINLFVPFAQTVEPFYYRIFLIIFIFVLLIFYFLSIFSNSIKKNLYHKSQFLLGIGIALAIWDLLTTKSNIFKLPFFPGPVHIIEIMVRDWKLLIISSLYSMRLFFAGLIAGVVLGIGTGILIGWNRQWHYWLFPIVKISGIIPAIAWIPITIAIFPNSFLAGTFLIFISSWFSVSSMTADGIASTPKAYFEVAKTLGANEKYLLFSIAVPNAAPNIFVGISIATGFAFVTLVVSEMIGAKAGLGWYINWAKGWSAYNKVYAAIIIMAIAFSIILAIIDAFRKYVLRWQRGILK